MQSLLIVGTADAQIVYRRSSARPVEYAILLQVRGTKGWETMVKIVFACWDGELSEVAGKHGFALLPERLLRARNSAAPAATC